MKILLGLLAGAVLVSCAAITRDPWEWMDQPENQVWKKMTVNYDGMQLSFSVPDKLKGGTHMIAWPKWPKGETDLVIDIPDDADREGAIKLSAIDWEYYWGGFYKAGENDYSFSAFIIYMGEEQNQLDLSVEQRIRKIVDSKSETYRVGMISPPTRESVFFENIFFDEFKVGWIKTSQNYEWTVENNPVTEPENELYRLPIDKNHELWIRFFYRINFEDERPSGTRGDDWMERRKQLSRKILETVKIVPDPKGGMTISPVRMVLSQKTHCVDYLAAWSGFLSTRG